MSAILGGMWRLVEKLLQIVLLVATAATVFVVAAVAWSTVWTSERAVLPTDPVDALVEVRLSSHGDVSHLFVGQPLVVEVVLLNLDARRARNASQLDPGAAAAASILLDSRDAGESWEQRLRFTLSTPGRARVLNTLDWNSRLLDSGAPSTPRRLALAPARTTLVIDGADLATLLPGEYVLAAALPPDIVPPERVATIPLEFELFGEPTQDTERAEVSLAVARVAALRGEPAQAVEAALISLALDPLRDEALSVVAEGWEQQGEFARAVEWYERYLETLGDNESARRRALEEYIEALRDQLDEGRSVR